MGLFTFFLLAVFFNILGYEYLIDNEYVFLAFNVFQLISIFLISYFWKKNVKQNFIFLYFFIAWFIYHSFGLIRISFQGDFRVEDIYFTYFTITFSSILVLLGIRFSRFFSKSSFKLLYKPKISNKTFYVLASLFLIYNFFVFYISGGFYNYFFSDYQNKVPESLKTTLFIISGVLSYFKFLNISYLFNRDRNSPKLFLVLGMLIFLLITTLASGASMGILSIFLVIYLYKYCLTEKRNEINSIKKYMYLILSLGSISAILIRFNRGDYSSFSFNILKDLKSEILSSPTFDSAGNFIFVLNKLSPQYLPNQLFYPLVNFLPRSIFPWKPLELGRIISYELYGFNESEIGGFAPTPMGEFYYDFGYFGILIGMFLIGLIIGIIQNKINLAPNSKMKWMLLVVIMSLVGTLPAWYTGFGVRIVYLIFFILMIKYIEKFLKIFKNK